MASLLTRIAQAADPHSSERHTYREHDVEAAVLRNVRQILNTRHGSALSCPEYGVIQLSELVHDFPDAIGLMQRAIKHTLALHEPRLRNVQVRHVKRDDPHEFNLDFEITGQVELRDGRRHAVRFSSTVDAHGNVELT